MSKVLRGLQRSCKSVRAAGSERGTSEEREKEAQVAALCMGARFRENLGLPDCGVMDSVENRNQIASVSRRHRPKLVLAPYWQDRHPIMQRRGISSGMPPSIAH